MDKGLMLVQFQVVGSDRWYYVETVIGESWNLRPFTDALLGYICGYLSPEDAELDDEKAGFWFHGKNVVAFKVVE